MRPWSGPSRSTANPNCTTEERHFGKDVWLSRRGAIDTMRGTPGPIPGSMGTRTYVVTGKGYAPALSSAPHGAGREYGRMHAKRTFSYEQLIASMDGIEWSGSKAFVDEIPAAYDPPGLPESGSRKPPANGPGASCADGR